MIQGKLTKKSEISLDISAGFGEIDVTLYRQKKILRFFTGRRLRSDAVMLMQLNLIIVIIRGFNIVAKAKMF